VPADPRLALALKYQHAGLTDAAWAALRELVAEADADEDALRLGLALRTAAAAWADVAELNRRLLARRPDDGALWCAQGDALERLGRPLEAIAAYERAAALAPTLAAAHVNLGGALIGQGRFAAAAATLHRALALAPDNAAALVNLGVAEVERGAVAQGQACFRRALALAPGNRDAADNLLFSHHNISDDPADLLALHRRLAPLWPARRAVPVRNPAPARRWRIGYVSPDFRRHSVAFFVEPLLRHHDRAAVAVVCYADVAAPDEVTARFRALADVWRDVHGCSDAALAEQIAADGIDVLVDLAGHTQGNRLGVFAAGAAPVQLTALGYPGTTGLAAFDGRLCDALTDPPGSEAASAEPLVRIPGGMHCYRPPAEAPAVEPLPCAANGVVTFGSFNKLAKISPATVALWAAVLAAVPGARLLVKAKPLAEAETRQQLAARFAAAGVAPGRLELLGWAPDDRGHLDLYNRVDIALDTFPYNGTTTTCEALWMGVPVLTLAGRTHAARVGVGLLHSLGASAWVADSPRRFVDTAVRLAADAAALAEVRAGLRARMAASRLCDGPAYARAVETAYAAIIGVRAG